MIDLGEVGARFVIIDEASAVLRAVTTQLENLDRILGATKANLSTLRIPPGVNRQLALMGENLGKLDAITSTTGAAVSANFAKMDSAIAVTQSRVAALGAEMRALGRIPAGGGGGYLPGGGGGGGGSHNRPGRSGGGHGGGSSGYISGPGAGIPGVAHASGHGGSMAALGLVGYGVYLEAEVEDIAARAMLTGQVPVDENMSKGKQYQQVRKLIQDNAAKTGFSPKDIGEALLATERQFGGLSYENRIKEINTLLPYAAAEARLKESSLKESFEAMVGLAHMTGTYSPEKLPELMRQFSYASMITPAKIPQFRNAISYSMPMLTAGLNMDPSSVMFLTSMLQTAGVTNSKSGTWLRSFFENAEPRVGATLSKNDITHNEALKSMGMLDKDGKVAWQVKGADGKVDWNQTIVKLSDIMAKFTKSADDATRLSLLRHGFGERGGGFGALMNLPEFVAQFPELQKKMKAFKGGDDVIEQLMHGSPVAQARGAWADLQNVLMDIGQSVLPPLTFALGGFDAVLKKMHESLGDDGASAAIGSGVIGGFLAWMNRKKLATVLPEILPALGRVGGGLLGPLSIFGAGMAGIASSATPAQVAALQASQDATARLHLGQPDKGAFGMNGPGSGMGMPNKGALPLGAIDLSGAADRAIAPIAPAIEGALEKIPGSVDPSITSAFDSVSRTIVNAIQSLAAAANAAAAAIPTAPGGQKLEIHSHLKVDGRTLAKSTQSAMLREHRTVNSSNGFDGGAHWAGTDVG